MALLVGTPAPIDFETMVTVKSKSKGTQSKQVRPAYSYDVASPPVHVSSFCRLGDSVDSSERMAAWKGMRDGSQRRLIGRVCRC